MTRGIMDLPTDTFKRNSAQQNIDPEFVAQCCGISEDLLGKCDNSMQNKEAEYEPPKLQEIDFNANYGDVIANVICKDCQSGKHIVARVFQEYMDNKPCARIWVYCLLHGEWEPSIIAGQGTFLDP